MEHTYQAWDGVPKDSLATHRTYNPYNYKNETDNYWQDNYQLHYSKEINSNLNANIALHYTRGKGYYENLIQDSKFSSFNLPDAIFNSDTITSSDFITQRWLKNDFYGFTYSFNYTKNKISTVIGGGWNQYSGNHFGDIIWAKIVTFDGNKYRWYQGTGDKKDLNTFFKVNYSLTKRINLYADLQFRNINYSIGGFDEYLKDVTQNHKYNFFNPKAGFSTILLRNKNYMLHLEFRKENPTEEISPMLIRGKHPAPKNYLIMKPVMNFTHQGFMLRGNIYYMNYADQLILTGEINNVGATILTNVPKSYRQGIEIETGIRILEKLNWYENITISRNIIPVFIDYTDNWDTGTQDFETLKNRTISFSPSVIASSVIDYIPFKNFHLSANSKYVGKQYIDNTQNSGRMLNPYLVQNISFLYTIQNKIFKELTCQFVVNNLFDKKYETNAWVYKYNEGGSLHVMDGYFPQAGINYMFKIGVKF